MNNVVCAALLFHGNANKAGCIETATHKFKCPIMNEILHEGKMDVKEQINHRHVLGIDLLRMLAAVLVLFYHFGFWIAVSPETAELKPGGGLVSFPELHDYTNFGWVGVQVFFVISGFVIAFSGEKATPFSFFTSRVVRLGPGVWLCASLTLGITLLLGFGSVSLQLKEWVKSVLFIPVAPWIDGSYWTLGIEIAFYFLVYLLIRVNRFVWIYRLALIIGGISAIFWIAQALIGFDNTSAIGVIALQLRRSRILSLALVHHGIFFALGVLIWHSFTKEYGKRDLAIGMFLCIIGCIQIAAASNSVNRDAGTQFTPILPCLIWVVSLIMVLLSIRLNYAVHQLPAWLLSTLRTAGLMTFPLYLLHQVAGGVIMGAMIGAGYSRWTCLIITILLMVGLAWLVATQIEPLLQRWTKSRLLYAREQWLSRWPAVAKR